MQALAAVKAGCTSARVVVHRHRRAAPLVPRGPGPVHSPGPAGAGRADAGRAERPLRLPPCANSGPTASISTAAGASWWDSNRHQSFPYVGNAMPRRVQRRDADLVRRLGANTWCAPATTPKAAIFWTGVTELGLLVFEEMPGWQHIGGPAWQGRRPRQPGGDDLRHYNHPSIVLWGVRVNESPDDDAFYRRTNERAHALDPTRPTGGVRCHTQGSFQEDVFTFNDFTHTGGERVFRTRQGDHRPGPACAPADHREQRPYVPHQALRPRIPPGGARHAPSAGDGRGSGTGRPGRGS